MGFEGFLSWATSAYAPTAILAAWGVIVLSCAALHAVERIFPAEPGQSYRGMLTNAKATIVYLVAGPFVSYMVGDTVARIVHWAGGPWLSIDAQGWFDGLPLASKILAFVPLAMLPLFAFDFFYYWFHRLQHTSSWLWEQHKLHHSDANLNVTTALRHHWLEELFRAFLILVPLTALVRISPLEAGLFAIVLGQWGRFIHMNLRARLGPLSPIFCGPQVHRIHHSLEAHHLNRNYAAFFPIWDVLFGTYYHPKRGEFPRTGVAGEPSDLTMTTILAGPFIAWGRRLRTIGLVGKNSVPHQRTDP